MKKLFFLCVAIMVMMASTTFISCSADDSPSPNNEVPTAKSLPTLTTRLSSVTTSTVAVGAENVTNGNATITEFGVYLSTVQNDRSASAKKSFGTSLNATTFNNVVSSLVTNTTYYVTAYAVNEKGTGYGTEMTVVTTLAVPTISGVTFSGVNKHNATFTASIEKDPALVLSDTKFLVSPYPNVTIENATGFILGTINGSLANQTITASFTGGNPGDEGYVRLVTTIGGQRFYSTESKLTLTGYKLGQERDGGIVVAVWNDGSNARILASHHPTDPTAPVGTPQCPEFGFRNFLAGTSTAAGSGYSNTQILMQIQPSQVPFGYINPYAAYKLAWNSTYAGYDDWYMSSKGDLEVMMQSVHTIFKTEAKFNEYLGNTGGLHTSSEPNASCYYNFGYGYNGAYSSLTPYKWDVASGYTASVAMMRDVQLGE